MLSTREIGSAAEQAVLEHYKKLGYTLVQASFSSFLGKQVGEIDLILRGPSCSENIRFVEVKARSSGSAALYVDALLPKFKRRRIAQTARYFMYSHPEYASFYWHFDLAVVKLQNGAFDNSPKNITIVSDVSLD